MLTTFDQAKDLKELDYNEDTSAFYNGNNKTTISTSPALNHNLYSYKYSRPKLQDVCTWLRTKGLHVSCDTQVEGHWIYMIRDTTTCKIVDTDFLRHKDKQTHDTALSSAVTKALEILKRQRLTSTLPAATKARTTECMVR